MNATELIRLQSEGLYWHSLRKRISRQSRQSIATRVIDLVNGLFPMSLANHPFSSVTSVLSVVQTRILLKEQPPMARTTRIEMQLGCEREKGQASLRKKRPDPFRLTRLVLSIALGFRVLDEAE